jgi:hypothetical protein
LKEERNEEILQTAVTPDYSQPTRHFGVRSAVDAPFFASWAFIDRLPPPPCGVAHIGYVVTPDWC